MQASNNPRKKVLLLSAYNTPSHKSWCNGLTEHLPDFDWEYMHLPPRYFSWRIRGNPLSFIHKFSEQLKQEYDIVFATSMVDLATICGIYPNLANAKKVVYFHENQFAYPQSPNAPERLEPLMVNLYSALAADQVIFNSEHNRSSLLDGTSSFMQKMPDFSPVSIVDDLKQKSCVLPVPIKDQQIVENKKIPNSIIWNHRWEYDKNPEDFFAALSILKNRNIDFKLIIMGQQFRSIPDVFTEAKEAFAENIICWGEQSRGDYLSWLSQGEYIVSTAIHEFQGLSVMEGVQHGAIPIVPNRLSYPEIFSNDYLYGDDSTDLAGFLERLLTHKSKLSVPSVDEYTWSVLNGSYRSLLLALLDKS